VSAKEYSKLLKTTTGFRGAYPLVVPVKVGDYFELGKEGAMVHLGNVFNWPGWSTAIPVDTDDIGGSETHYAGCKRENAAEAGAQISTPVGLGAEATVSLSFSRASGFVLAYAAAKREKVRDVSTVQRHIVELARKSQWQEEWVLVTEVIAAGSATLVVSTEKASKFSLHANVALPQALKDVGIANPELGWTSSGWRGSGYSSLCNPGTPLYHCVKVKKSMLGTFKGQTLGSEELDHVFTDDPYG
jgi:hypothetical protein